MSVTRLPARRESRADRLFELLDKTDYRVVVSDEDRDAVFRLRYESYLREGAIAPDFSQRLSDRYDDLENTIIFGLHIDGELTGTIRVSIANSAYPEFPGMDVFPDYLRRELAAGKTLIDSTRFAVRPDASREHNGLLPYVMARISWMVAESFEADGMLAAVRPEHRAFYARTMQFEVVDGPGFYPKLNSPHFLMMCDYPVVRESVQQRYPVFRSSAFERRALLAQPMLTAPRLEDFGRLGLMSGATVGGLHGRRTSVAAAPV